MSFRSEPGESLAALSPREGTPAARAEASPFQWFLQRSRDEIFLIARSKERWSREDLLALAEEIVRLVPAAERSPFHDATTPERLSEIVSLEEREDEESSIPDLLQPCPHLFDRPDRPPLRVIGVNLREAESGTAGLIAIHFSHAVVEGKDLVQLLRSRTFDRAPRENGAGAESPWLGLGIELAALFAVPFHLLHAQVTGRRRKSPEIRTVTLPRRAFEELSDSLGVGRRVLLYSLVTHALVAPDLGGITRRSVTAACIGLEGRRSQFDDKFLQARARKVRMPIEADFRAHVAGVGEAVTRAEQSQAHREQLFLNALLRWQQRLSRVLPFLYGERFFRYRSQYDFVLSMLPPVRLSGPIGDRLAEPVHIGARHQGENLCAFALGHESVTLTLTLEERYQDRVDRIAELVAGQE